jgi:hypothetical protein
MSRPPADLPLVLLALGFLLFLSGCGGSSPQSVVTPPPPPPSDCGPPTYACTAKNNAALAGGPLAVVNNPSPVPNVGNLTGAGTVITDPDFGNPIARCTDANTDPSAPNIAFNINSGATGIVNHFNQNDTIIYVQETGGIGVPLLFDAQTMQCSRMYAANPAYAATGGLTIDAVGADFSYSNPNWLYVWISTGGVAQIYRYDFSNYSSSGSPTITLIADFIADTGSGFSGTPGNCLPANFVSQLRTRPDCKTRDFTLSIGKSVRDAGFTTR